MRKPSSTARLTRRTQALRWVAIAIVLWCPRQAAAQGERFHPFGVAVAQAAKDAVRDPTTYGPASLLYVSSRLDWDSSQPFFQHGAVEENPRYTVSGFGHDVPLSYAAGNRKLVTDALSVAAVSFVANTIEDVALRALIARQPEHRRLWKALGWIERTAVASSLGYTFSVRHFEQWQRNERRAGQLGY